MTHEEAVKALLAKGFFWSDEESRSYHNRHKRPDGPDLAWNGAGCCHGTLEVYDARDSGDASVTLRLDGRQILGFPSLSALAEALAHMPED